MPQRCDQLLRRSVGQRERLVARLGFGRIHHAVDPPVAFVSQSRLVGIAFACLESGGRRIVLDDVVVPVQYPHVPVRADLGHDRRGPFVVAGQQIHGAGRAEVGSVGFQQERTDQLAGRAADERGAVPVLGRIPARGVQRVPRAGRVAAVMIDLPDAVGDRPEQVRVGDAAQLFGAPAADPFVVPVRDRHVDAGVGVGGAAEDQPLFADAQSPGVVVRRPDEFQLAAVRPEAEESHSERVGMRSAGDHRLGRIVALHGPDPVVQAVLEIAHPAVRVAHAPAADQHMPLVRSSVSVGVF